MQWTLLRALTWVTVVAAVVSAVMLSGGDAALPDAEALPDAVAAEIEQISDAVAAPDGASAPSR